ncbi:MAG TPA: deoxyribodipyrimidine photo-lyase [Thermoanaerobaculia bacterium]
MPPIVHWFRRDLRVADNTALSAAARDGDGVVAVFILDDRFGDDPGIGPARFQFLRESLEDLEKALAGAGGRLDVLRGPAVETLPRLLVATGASAVYANAEIGPYPEKRDLEVSAELEAAGARLRLFPDALLVEPDALLSGRGEPYASYSPFARSWDAIEKRRPVAAPSRLAPPSARIPVVPLGRVRAWKDLARADRAPAGGASEAERLLAAFAAGPLEGYETGRDFPARDATSRLSPHLHFGTISPRTIAQAVDAAGNGPPSHPRSRAAAKFFRELAWREFFHHLLFHFPRVARESFQREMDAMPWQDAPGAVAAWKEGRTGYPFVDAGMRQLATTHWMHNRARMVAASFLTKDLHVHWSEGEGWFERELADADLANNNGGWQWVAGTGADAAPFFRIFNPVLQSRKFDPDGAYIRRYVPELASVPGEKIHEPWTMTPEEQRAARCRIGHDYPGPIVEHARERAAALESYGRLRKGARPAASLQ